MVGVISNSILRLGSQRVFLTGEPRCGKTTVVLRAVEILKARGLKVGGMLSEEMRQSGARIGFSVEDILTHETGILATTGLSQGPRIGRYTVNLRDLDEIGARAIQTAIEDADIIAIDELGPMELNSPRFIESVEAALNSHKNILGTIHKRAHHPLVNRVKSNPKFTILEVTGENRDQLPYRIADKVAPAK